MLVQFNGVWLTNDGSGTFPDRAITSTIGARLNGRELVQDAQFMRAVASVPMDRGNMSHVFTFKVGRNFQLLMPTQSNPVAQAAAFLLTHFSLLPKRGPLFVTCGGWGETPLFVRAPDAVLEGIPDHSYQGVAVETSYSIRCGAFELVAAAGGNPIEDSTGAHLKDSTGADVTD